MTNHSVNVARLVYLLVCQAAGVAIALSTGDTPVEISLPAGLLTGLAVGFCFIGIEKLMQGFTLRGFSTATFGLGVGLFCAWLLTRVQISALLELAFRDRMQTREDTEVLVDALRLALDITLFASLGFIGTVLALRSNRDDFAFIIPYVRFRQDASSGQPIVIDAETVMDGRVVGLMSSGFLSGKLIVADYILEEIQTMVSENGLAGRQRAERGLANLERMQSSPDIQVSIHEGRTSLEIHSTQNRLVETARYFSARLLTSDDSLTKVAKLQGVPVLNINELDLALRPSISVGEKVRVALVKPGKEAHQGVGYLPDGAMIVVNNAAEDIGKSVDVIVTSTLQTPGGTMVFGDLL